MKDATRRANAAHMAKVRAQEEDKESYKKRECSLNGKNEDRRKRGRNSYKKDRECSLNGKNESRRK